MAERRIATRRSPVECSYREEHVQRMENIEKDIAEIKDRIYNGMGAELRREVNAELVGLRKDFHEENKGTRRLVVGILISLLVSLAGIIIEGRFSSQQSSDENMRNYKAILQLEMRLEDHVEDQK